MGHEPALRAAAEHAVDYLGTVADRPVGPPVDPDALRARLGGDLPAAGEDPVAVVDALVADLDPGIVASAGPRYFGFVTGGNLPAAVAADWLGSAWDNNTAMYVMSPAIAVVEEVAARWVLDVLGLPADASVGFTTGASAANLVGLAAGRHHVLQDKGWDVEANGLIKAPQIRLVAGEEAHASLLSAARLAGLGERTWQLVAIDDQGAMRPEALRAAVDDWEGPLLVAAQVGNVNSGACDPIGDLAPIVHERGGWLHVDGAFGLWAGASPSRRRLVTGIDQADSWATDAHKWLNTPYDCGIAVVADPVVHRGATASTASYYVTGGDRRDGFDWVPEASRRGRGLPVYAALRSLGRQGVADLVDRCCDLAARMAQALQDGGVEILNDVVLNQVVIHFPSASGTDATVHRDAVLEAVHRDGTCWIGGTTWRDLPAARVSVSGWSTTAEDIDRSAAAILAAAGTVSGGA